jgi:carboxymethylenebutenolidase
MTTAATAQLERIEIEVGDGTRMAAHVAWPVRTTKNSPGIVLGQDAFGVTSFLHDVGRRFAALGVVAILPELYHRSGEGQVCSYDDREMVTCRPLQSAMTPDGMIADGVAAYDWLVAQDCPTERIAAMGFCMGGRLSYLINAHRPIKAGISLYGRIPPAIYPYAARQHGEMLMIWGGQDHEIPPEHYRPIADALTAGGARHTQVVLSEAPHAFFCHVRPWTYHEESARLAWALSTELLRQTGVLPAA